MGQPFLILFHLTPTTGRIPNNREMTTLLMSEIHPRVQNVSEPRHCSRRACPVPIVPPHTDFNMRVKSDSSTEILNEQLLNYCGISNQVRMIAMSSTSLLFPQRSKHSAMSPWSLSLSSHHDGYSFIYILGYWGFTFQTSTLSPSDTSTLYRYLKLDSFQKSGKLMSLPPTLS